ncbi:hypothetical protein Pyn_06589 [Prunus yedoensis var. nudiflora]|uniref:Uncharacterized protein n=1 Tax=Prunus yedoensis var. nudiflora TaxID=2094558 RepID=A0A314Y6F6_PRUYE|nr:hypothetical protein Pyn_06589 [Prunus yedoensis var. nudiflora]
MLGRGGFSSCSPWRPSHNTWASKVGPREFKSGGRYFSRRSRSLAGGMFVEFPILVQRGAKPNI